MKEKETEKESETEITQKSMELKDFRSVIQCTSTQHQHIFHILDSQISNTGNLSSIFWNKVPIVHP